MNVLFQSVVCSWFMFTQSSSTYVFLKNPLFQNQRAVNKSGTHSGHLQLHPPRPDWKFFVPSRFGYRGGKEKFEGPRAASFGSFWIILLRLLRLVSWNSNSLTPIKLDQSRNSRMFLGLLRAQAFRLVFWRSGDPMAETICWDHVQWRKATLNTDSHRINHYVLHIWSTNTTCYIHGTKHRLLDYIAKMILFYRHILNMELN